MLKITKVFSSLNLKHIDKTKEICGHYFQSSLFLQRSGLVNRFFKRNFSLQGVYPPITTPFEENENVSYKHLKANLEKWNTVPFRGYVVLGSSGEAMSLTSEERIDIAKFVKQNIPNDKLLIVGSGCESTKNTIEITQKVAADGADAVLVITPSFYKGRMTEEALYAHYTKVADSSSIPIILYSVPGNTTIDLSPSVIEKLADHPNIIGLKDSGGDVSKISYIIHKTKGKQFQVLAGSSGFFFPALSLGCVGGVLALADPIGEYLCKLYELFIDKKYEEAKNLQHRLIGPNLAVTKRFGIQGIKTAMEQFGFYGGPSRYPLLPLSEEEKQSVINEFKINGFL